MVIKMNKKNAKISNWNNLSAFSTRKISRATSLSKIFYGAAFSLAFFSIIGLVFGTSIDYVEEREGTIENNQSQHGEGPKKRYKRIMMTNKFSAKLAIGK